MAVSIDRLWLFRPEIDKALEIPLLCSGVTQKEPPLFSLLPPVGRIAQRMLGGTGQAQILLDQLGYIQGSYYMYNILTCQDRGLIKPCVHACSLVPRWKNWGNPSEVRSGHETNMHDDRKRKL